MSGKNNKTLILMVGLPRSGKSTKALKLGYPIVSPDAIRLAIHNHYFIHEAEGLVWTFARYMVQALFEAGHNTVILDACNAKRKRRAQWTSKKWESRFCVVNTPAHECRSRAGHVSDTGLCSDLIAAIDRMEDEYEPVAQEEGEII